MLATFLEQISDRHIIAPRRMAERLSLPMAGLARLAHLNRNTMAAKPESPAVQAKLGQIARIIARAAELSGNEDRAIIWFKYQVIPGFGRTAEQLVEEGHAQLVLEDLDRMEAGVYA